jgi:hypothetical protein
MGLALTTIGQPRTQKRRALVGGDVVRIPLTHGKMAIVDLIDGDLGTLNWYAKEGHGTWYAMRLATAPHKIRLHRVIAERAGIDVASAEVDHRDGDGLNCRRLNLRAATHAQNAWNRGGVKGAYFHRGAGLWHARIKTNGIDHSIGYYPSFDDARAAYLAAAERLHGEFLRTA